MGYVPAARRPQAGATPIAEALGARECVAGGTTSYPLRN